MDIDLGPVDILPVIPAICHSGAFTRHSGASRNLALALPLSSVLERVVNCPVVPAEAGTYVHRRQYSVATAGNPGSRTSGNDESEVVGHHPK